jgi:hypothetical protein
MTTENLKPTETPIYLGWQNGWSVAPEIVKNCTHTIFYIKKVGYKEMTCSVCNFTYNVDSSD